MHTVAVENDPLYGARRISVYGVTGSGKSTAAAAIAAATGLEWHSVDDLTWESGWVAVAPDEQRRRIAAICERDSWVLDTMYDQWIDVPLPRLELIVALDYPRWLSFGRLLRRTVTRIVDRRSICNGNVETLRSQFARDSILLWHFRSFARKRDRIQGWAATWTQAGEGPRVLRFRRPRDLENWIAQLTPVRS
jgi:adenylate kinase family enzyme